ncbi:glycosyl hydrolase family 88 [Parabacteroides sp. 52]|uniref:glycoside hydrolase family 88 protein n=1 Tax=unclassified Parabacteroides TaxID=2649774 RepID=UPI0013D7AAD1|nr:MULTISPECIES: glycoside hydrolase family 88 protein [unclassified Parabacteroides]MDH6535258.1 unsaturated chondroitin disaccharide hydrolase [Parabacteroides sp. PM5-20]NDV55821.1 glycosyl hydrolase family 88 [Parabacteroides sp. 52]
MASLTACNSEVKEEKKFIEENTTFASAQTVKMLETTGEPNGKNFPRRINKEGKLSVTNKWDWTPGFFPGTLWYLYELTGDTVWQQEAEKWTWQMEEVQHFSAHHDIGFMMYCSYGNAERLASRPEYKDILVQSANSLCTRFSDTTQVIESWNYRKAWDGTEWFYPVIIDNMMNLELLFYASKVTGDPKYYDVAVTHANTTLKNHFREDYSSYHVVNYDETTGEALHRQTCQGYSDNSTWSRGQAWAIYGYTMSYRETKDPAYLEAAKNFAQYYIDHLPEDLVPLWDFNVGEEGYIPQGNSYAVQYPAKVKDASAAAITCSAFFELGEITQDPQYTDLAIRMLKSLASPAYRAPLGENANFIIMHCTGSLPHRSEIDSPLVYADYYFLEALIRYKRYLSTL